MQLAMGGEARIVLYAASEDLARGAARAAFERIAALERVLSDWDPASELSRLSDAAGGAPLAVSPDLGRALALARELAAASGGAFDPTLGALTKLWRAAEHTGEMPDEAAIAAARRMTGWRDLEVDAAAGTARLGRPGMRLDLGAIGQGLACDAALAVLAGAGIESALVELAGDFALGAPPPGASGWRITFELGPGEAPLALDLARCGAAVSGDDQRFIATRGGAGPGLSHVIDPLRGFGLPAGAAALVVARDATRADALSTACRVLGRERGAELAASQAAELYWSDRGASNTPGGSSGAISIESQAGSSPQIDFIGAQAVGGAGSCR
jgi:thiamine biosynthesis lipoprotein